jgi:N-acetylmuramoyl-L-alanine amidase
MPLTITSNRIVQATQQPGFASSGTNTRRYVVIHYPATDTLQKTFNALRPGKAYHIVIDRNGDLHQLAPFDRGSAHSGHSEWKGLQGLNSNGIAVSLQNVGRLKKQGGRFVSESGAVFDPGIVGEARPRLPTSGSAMAFWERFTDGQLNACEEVLKALVATFPTLTDLIGHDEIAMGRRDDPGPLFPWTRFRPLFARAATDFGPVLRVKTGGAPLRKAHDLGSGVIANLPAGTSVHLRSSVFREGTPSGTIKTGIVAVARENSIEHAGFMERTRLA